MQRRFAVLTTTLLLLCVCLTPAAAQRPTPPPPPDGGNNGNPPPQGGGGNQTPLTIDTSYQGVASTYTGIGTISTGEGQPGDDLSLTQACTSRERFESGGTGTVTDDQGTAWIVPMEVNTGDGSVDMYNDCTGSGDNPDFASDLKTVVINEDGEIITGYIFADNYFELYVNGQFVGRDNINFIPFNASAVRFKAKYPLTIAVHMADWESHYGVGMEYDSYNVGDGGFIAYFDNGVITNDAWKVLPVYIAPLDDPACVTEDASGNPDSSQCSIQPVCSTTNPAVCRALHYPIPENWTAPDFDDSAWLNATLYEAREVTNAAGYVNMAQQFGKASFIWSSSLKLDNSVLARLTVDAPPSP